MHAELKLSRSAEDRIKQFKDNFNLYADLNP